MIAADEAPLVERARRGDLRAFSGLVELYQERAVRVAWSIVGNLEDARDLAQDAFVKAFENIASFKAESRFYTWYYRILANACKDFLRKKSLRRFVPFAGGHDEDGEELLAPEVRSGCRDPRQALGDVELGEAIRSALRHLPERQRAAFALRYLERLSLAEIAESLGLSEGAVKAHLWQAGQKMKRLLSAWTHFEEDDHEKAVV